MYKILIQKNCLRTSVFPEMKVQFIHSLSCIGIEIDMTSKCFPKIPIIQTLPHNPLSVSWPAAQAWVTFRGGLDYFFVWVGGGVM